MLRNFVLFFAMLFVALTAGRAFWACVGENPANVSGATYVEFFKSLDRQIATPIAITGVGGTLLAGIAALMYRRERALSYLLLAACVGCAVASMITIIVHLPINARIATWNPSALPANYREYLDRWWEWQKLRLVGLFGGMCLIFVAVLLRKSPAQRS